MEWKKILTFVIILVVILLISNVFLRGIIPIKPIRFGSQNMEPTYNKNDVLFYSPQESYSVGDVIILETERNPMVTRITSINQDRSYEAKSDNNPVQLAVEKEIQKSEIKGKVSSSASPYLFYTLLWGIQIIIALLLTNPIYSKVNKNN